MSVEFLESRQVLSTTDLSAIIAEPAIEMGPLATSASPSGLTPAEVRSAYGVDSIRFGNVVGDGSGQTIAIVVAYGSPTIASDLKQFDQTFGLSDPPSLTIYKQQGLNQVDAGWALETALDVEWAHAIAPKANIMLVEAKSSSLNDLLSAVDFARKQSGVVSVSMSWGSSEFWSESAYDSVFTTPAGHVGGSGFQGGVTFVAASGDNGAWYGSLWPASSPNVLSVGGTSLTATAFGTYVSETGWSGSGGGYSRYYAEPSYQTSAQTSGVRTTPDVAFNADPSSGFSVYSTVSYAGQTGWFTVGGTSAGAPQWAAIVAIADQGLALAGKGSMANAQALVYQLSTSDFHDISSGSNGYNARPGYDLVTGLGSPKASQVVTDLVALQTGASTTTSTTLTSTPSTTTRGPRRAIVLVASAGTTSSFDPTTASTTIVVLVVQPNQPVPQQTSSTAGLDSGSSTDTILHASVVPTRLNTLDLLEAHQVERQGRPVELASAAGHPTLAIPANIMALPAEPVSPTIPAGGIETTPQLPPSVRPEIWDVLFESADPLICDGLNPLAQPDSIPANDPSDAEQPGFGAAAAVILGAAAIARLNRRDEGSSPSGSGYQPTVRILSDFLR